jgi:hypothetical protein
MNQRLPDLMIRIVVNKSIAALVLLLMVPLILPAQNNITVKASVDRSQVLIGEKIQLRLEANIPINEPIRFFQFDTLPHFEISAREKIDTSDLSDGTALSQVIYITSFDSGHWVIQPFILTANVSTDSIPIDVGYTPFDPAQPYHDIKDIIEVNPEKNKENNNWLYIAAAVVVLLLTIIGLLLRSKKEVPPPPVAIPVDPYKEAIQQLDLLWKDKPDAKQYYSRLTDIFRSYVFARKGIHSLKETTGDLINQLKSLNIPPDLFEQLAQSLRLSDFVKFAKYIPTEEDDNTVFQVIKTTIDTIEQTG